MGLEGGGHEGGRGCTATPAAEGAERRGAASSLQFQTSSPTSLNGPTHVQQDDTKSSAAPLVRVNGQQSTRGQMSSLTF